MQTACWEDAALSSLARSGPYAGSRVGPGMDRPARRVRPAESGASPAEPGVGFRAGGERGDSGPPADAGGGIRASGVAFL